MIEIFDGDAIEIYDEKYIVRYVDHEGGRFLHLRLKRTDADAAYVLTCRDAVIYDDKQYEVFGTQTTVYPNLVLMLKT